MAVYSWITLSCMSGQLAVIITITAEKKVVTFLEIQILILNAFEALLSFLRSCSLLDGKD